MKQEESSSGKAVFEQLLSNAALASKERISLCQDAGLAVVFIRLGQDVHLVGGDLTAAVNQGVRQGYSDGYLRPSVLDPMDRVNTGDNTPAIVHLELIPGDQVGITVFSKGFGGENMSRVRLFHPAVGLEGARDYVLKVVDEAGGNPCPPIIVGVGIGGNLEMSALLAKKSLLRPLGQKNIRPEIAKLEEEWLVEVNKLGIGPQGLGGRITALDLHIETYPTHIGSLPVAVNIQCHSHRHKSAVI